MRVVSDILESNGASSMASVCGGCLSLMDAGVPVKAHVAGIAMGLIKEGNRFAVLTDILGDEDHLGDMDFKVAGTANGVTALQMDIKIQGITKEIMQVALAQAKEARMHILGKMQDALGEAKTEVSTFAPRLYTMKINPEKIRDVLGKDGLLHFSQIAQQRVEKVTDYLSEGQVLRVKVLETDDKGRVKLSMKALLERPEGMPEEAPRERRERSDRPPRGEYRGDRGERGDSGERRDHGVRPQRAEGESLPPEQREQQAPREPLPQVDAADTPPQT